MAIYRVSGQMLQSTLVRDGNNIAFANTANSVSTLFVDIANSRVGVNSNVANVTLDVQGNIFALNLSSTGNVTAANVNGVVVSATGNVYGGNVITNNVYNSSGALNIYSVSNGNILLTPDGTGFTKAVGTNGFVIPVGNTAQRPGTPDTGTLRFNTSLIQTEIWDGAEWVSATGTTSAITNQTLNGDGSTLNFTLDYEATAESILVSINGVLQTPSVDYITSGTTLTFTTAPAAGDVIQVRFIAATTVISALVNGTSNISIPTSNGNIAFGVGGNPNIILATSTGANITGYANVSGNISGGNVSATTLSGTTVTATTHNGTTFSASGNITGSNVIGTSLIGTVYTNSILNSGANGTGNIGNSSTYFNTIFAKATSAQYADLAEFYSADAEYEPGTVLSFGGDYEVTLSADDADPCVAGVVSTNPSYIMNAGIFCEFPTQVALTGRVPCRVVGPVTKGAMMISAGNGRARAAKSPAIGTVIGKALEAFDGAEGTIEIVVGRL